MIWFQIAVTALVFFGVQLVYINSNPNLSHLEQDVMFWVALSTVVTGLVSFLMGVWSI
jgi:hypothetical protein